MTLPGEEMPSLRGPMLPGPNVASHTIQQDKEQNAFLIDQQLVVCTQIEYRVLALLLEHADRCVTYAVESQLLSASNGD